MTDIISVSCGGETLFTEELGWESFLQAWLHIEQHTQAGEKCDLFIGDAADLAMTMADPAVLTALV